MDKLFLFFMYLLTTMIAVLITLQLLGFTNLGYKGILIGLVNGINDYIVREILVGKVHFFSGFHFITGILIISILSFLILGKSKKVSLAIPIIAYAITSVSEIMMLLLLIPLFGKVFLEKAQFIPYMQALLGLVIQFPVIVVCIALKIKSNKKKYI